MRKMFVVTEHQRDLDFNETGTPSGIFPSRESAERGIVQFKREVIESHWSTWSEETQQYVENLELKAEWLDGRPEDFVALFEETFAGDYEYVITEVPVFEEN